MSTEYVFTQSLGSTSALYKLLVMILLISELPLSKNISQSSLQYGHFSATFWSKGETYDIGFCSLSYLIVGFNLPDENRKVLNAQCRVIVHFLVGPLHRGLRISVGGKKGMLFNQCLQKRCQLTDRCLLKIMSMYVISLFETSVLQFDNVLL